MQKEKLKMHIKVVIISGAVLLAALALFGIYAMFCGGQTASAPDITSWEWQTVDDGRITLLSPGALTQTVEPGGQTAWQTPDSVIPYVRLVRLGEVPGTPTEETLEAQLKTLLMEITAQEQALETPYFFINEEGTPYAQMLTAPESGLLSVTRVFVAENTMYCVYLTTIGDFAEPAFLEMLETFLDSVDITRAFLKSQK